MSHIEVKANNGEEIVAYELDFMTALIYFVMGFNPDDQPFAVAVFSAEDPGPDATLEEAAPLHMEFADTYEEARDRAEQIAALINGGTFEYQPPNLDQL